MSPRTIRCAIAATAMFVIACAESSPVTGPEAPPLLARKPPQTSNPTATRAFPLDDGALAIRSDGQFVSGDESIYADGVCGVKGTIFLDGSGDNTMQTDNPTYKDRKCAHWPRRITVVYPDGRQETGPLFSNLHALQTNTSSIPIGATVRRPLNINLSLTSSRCDVLRYASIYQNTQVIDADSIEVTRIDARTWEVASQPPPNDRAWCTTNGESYHMPVRFRVIASQDLP